MKDVLRKRIKAMLAREDFDRKLEGIRREAGSAGDVKTVRACEVALGVRSGSSARAKRAVARLLVDAEGMKD